MVFLYNEPTPRVIRLKTTITESISAITSIFPSMKDMVSASIGPVMTSGIAMSFSGYGMKRTGHTASPMNIPRMY